MEESRIDIVEVADKVQQIKDEIGRLIITLFSFFCYSKISKNKNVLTNIETERKNTMAKKERLNEKGVPFGARQRMPIWYGAVWSTRGIAAAINVVLVVYVTFYSTDLLGLNPTIIGGILLASRIVDAFTDLGFGYILECFGYVGKEVEAGTLFNGVDGGAELGVVIVAAAM